MTRIAHFLVFLSFCLNFGSAFGYAVSGYYNLSLYWTGGALLVGSVWWRSGSG